VERHDQLSVPAASRTAAATTAPDGSRVVAVDLIRGAVMLLMAVDQARVYSGLPPGGATTGIFFTRWVTHFCARFKLRLSCGRRLPDCRRISSRTPPHAPRSFSPGTVWVRSEGCDWGAFRGLRDDFPRAN